MAHSKQRVLSFKGVLQTITAFEDALRVATPTRRERLVREMLRAIASNDVGDRPGRCEPRANKRRPKPQKYLMEPRRERRQASIEFGLTKNRVPFGSEDVSRVAQPIRPRTGQRWARSTEAEGEGDVREARDLKNLYRRLQRPSRRWWHPRGTVDGFNRGRRTRRCESTR